jgi:hypothetical protein
MYARFKGIILHAAEGGNDTRMTGGNRRDTTGSRAENTEKNTEDHDGGVDFFLFGVRAVSAFLNHNDQRKHSCENGKNAENKNSHKKLLFRRACGILFLGFPYVILKKQQSLHPIVFLFREIVKLLYNKNPLRTKYPYLAKKEGFWIKNEKNRIFRTFDFLDLMLCRDGAGGGIIARDLGFTG